jgi:branched-subunit amino acid ABC-type transport system permease component/ABC-type branched-subunit amino acid transport system ATPase component
MALDIIIAGLINGSTYALLAIGFSLIFGVARIVNIAHTAFYMVASYCIFLIVQKLGYRPTVGMLVAVPLITLLGLICYKLFIDPIREHEAAVLIGTIALAIALQEIMLLIFTGDYLSVPALVKGYFTIFDVKVFYQQLLTFVVALIILGALRLLLMNTKLGLAIRSTAEDREVANLMGINESRVAMITMGISVGLAAVTGSVVVPLTTISPFMWMHPLIMMMADRFSSKVALIFYGKKTWDIVNLGIACTFQNMRPFRRLPIIANVMVSCLCPRAMKRGEWVKRVEAKAMDALEFAGISDMALEKASTLSQGDLKRLEVARAVATEPDLLLLDEPFGGLSPAETELMAKSIKRLHKGGRFGRLHSEGPAMIIVEHKLQQLMKIVDRIIVLNFGTIITVGTPQEVVNDPQVIKAYLGEGDI